MRRLKKALPTIFISLLFIAGVGVIAYPTVSDRWNAKAQSRAVAIYNDAVAGLPEEDHSYLLQAAKEYNEALKRAGADKALLKYELVPGYEDTLDVTGTGIMGTVSIPGIDVELPIYHGTGPAVLAKGAGHLEGSSLPIGGEGSHCVISAHRGLPSSKLFTDLDQLEEGDIFTLNVLGEALNYKVDQIVTVLPSEIEELYPQKGRDCCTLMTCTPYGINTHRLLVRGQRIYLTSEETEILTQEAGQTAWPLRKTVQAAVMIAAAVIITLLLSEAFVLIFRKRRKGNHKTDEHS